MSAEPKTVYAPLADWAVFDSAEKLAAVFDEPAHQELAKALFHDVTTHLVPGRLEFLQGCVPSARYCGADGTRQAIANGEMLLALRGCTGGWAEVWVVHRGLARDTLAEAEQLAKELAHKATGNVLSVVRLREVPQGLH